jgi:hypothetical protein
MSSPRYLPAPTLGALVSTLDQENLRLGWDVMILTKNDEASCKTSDVGILIEQE